MALPGIVEKLMTDGPVKPSVWLLVCDIIWLVIFSLFGCINILVDDFNIVEIGGYVASILLTTVISNYHFEIPSNQLFVYLPALVDLGIFIAAVGIAIARMPEDQRRKLVEGLKGFRDSIANLLPAALLPTGAGGVPGNMV
jgi:predicted neutral ceramidase superfamily lipid hydrolase